MQEGPGGHRGDAAAAERRLALVVAAVADRGQADDQSAAKVPDAGVYHHAVFPPSDTHFDEGSGGEKKKKMKRKKKERAGVWVFNTDSYSVSRLRSVERATGYICHFD